MQRDGDKQAEQTKPASNVSDIRHCFSNLTAYLGNWYGVLNNEQYVIV